MNRACASEPAPSAWRGPWATRPRWLSSSVSRSRAARRKSRWWRHRSSGDGDRARRRTFGRRGRGTRRRPRGPLPDRRRRAGQPPGPAQLSRHPEPGRHSGFERRGGHPPAAGIPPPRGAGRGEDLADQGAAGNAADLRLVQEKFATTRATGRFSRSSSAATRKPSSATGSAPIACRGIAGAARWHSPRAAVRGVQSTHLRAKVMQRHRRRGP